MTAPIPLQMPLWVRAALVVGIGCAVCVLACVVCVGILKAVELM